ncbi:hypothetical protein Lesp02_03390 [Lentzea sp. NBRC 105346]|uniref:conjugal transfer protein n=1 Tax=Lentzea sp. NBRC 105346 TaxID=3032205 RepID=UPI0024A483C9|nr:conjugal transfer protein [Lentzea sp. NBRC 105346]GLZ28149.1 hypothetical protein Lesp02_03390 [Lentzea sp. NBRC 105346]
MAFGDGTWRVLLGPNHETVRARLRARRASRRGLRSGGPASGTPAPPGTSDGLAGTTGLAGAGGEWPRYIRGNLDEMPAAHASAGSGAHATTAAGQVPDPRAETPAFDVLAARPRASGWVRTRRGLTITVLVVLVGAGAVSIAQSVARWARPATSPSTVRISEVDLVGAAVLAATDYLSWDTSDRPRRQAALHRLAAPGGTIDGWDGTGRQAADSATAIGLARLDDERAVVVTRVRVTPFTQATDSQATPPSTSSRAPEANGSSAPPMNAPGWTAGQSRWLTLSVQLASRDGRLVVTATPALVPAGPPPARYSSAAALTGASDESFAKSTQDSVAKFLESFASGELDFVRAPHARVSGLDRAVTLKKLVRWQAARAAADGHEDERVGTATVIWELPDGAGTLRCAYRITLRRHEDRWLLAAVDPEVDGAAS